LLRLHRTRKTFDIRMNIHNTLLNFLSEFNRNRKLSTVLYIHEVQEHVYIIPHSSTFSSDGVSVTVSVS